MKTGLQQKRPFQVRIPSAYKRHLSDKAKEYGVRYGIFFTTSGKAMTEHVNPNRQYSYIWETP